MGTGEGQEPSAAGDNEYGSATCTIPGASGYFTYLGDAASPNQPGCRSACPGYYSYDLGTWHVVVLNSNCSQPGVGGCGSTSPQGRWLAADLAAHRNQCVLAYWHLPRWTESGGVSSTSNYFVNALYNAGAEVILSGNNPSSGPAVRASTGSAGPRTPRSRSGRPTPYGILELTLHPSSYSWRFVPEAGRTFTDSGTQSCH